MFSLLKSVFIEQYSKYKSIPQIKLNPHFSNKKQTKPHIQSATNVEAINKGAIVCSEH